MTDPSTSRKIRNTVIVATLASSIALFSPVAEGAISVLGTSSAYTSGAGSGSATHTLSYDPGATSTAIVVSVVMEASGAPSSVKFDGVDMIPVVGASGSNVGIYYLNNPTTGGASNLTFDYSSVTTVNFIVFRAVSLNASDLIEAAAPATDTDTNVTLTVPTSDSFVMAGFNFNNGSGATTTSANAPLTGIFGAFINSGGGAIGYANGIADGDLDLSFSLGGEGSPAARLITAASFNVIPEPSTFVLSGLFFGGCILRRRRN